MSSSKNVGSEKKVRTADEGRRLCGLAAGAAASLMLMAPRASHAADTYTWTATAASDWTILQSPTPTPPTVWSSASNGTNNTLFPSVQDDAAIFGATTPAAARVITLNNVTNYTSNITIGTLSFDTGTTATAFALGPGTSSNATNPLVFDSTSTSGATATALQNGAAVGVTANVFLNTNLTIGSYNTSTVNRTFSIGGVATNSATTFMLNGKNLTVIPSTSSGANGTTTFNSVLTIGALVSGVGNITVDSVPGVNPSNTTQGGNQFRLNNPGNTFQGTITVNTGQILQLNAAGGVTIGAFGSPSEFGVGNGSSDASSIVLNQGSTLDVGSLNNVVNTMSRLFSLGGNATVTVSGNATSGCVFTNTGAIGFTTTSAATLTLNTVATNPASSIFSPQLVDNGASKLTVTKSGGGVWVITNPSNTYTGDTQINAGTLKLGANNAIGQAGQFRFGVNGTNGTLDLNGFNQTTTAGLGQSGTGTGSMIVNTGTQGSTLTIGVPGTGNNLKSFAGVITSSGTQTITLIKTGLGTQALLQHAGDTRAYSFTGGIQVNAGLLRIDSPLTTDAITVQTGGILGGTGSITAPVTFLGAGNGLAPGDSPGVLKITGAVSLGTGTHLDYELPVAPGAGVNDETDITGGLTVASNYVVNVLSISATGVYPLIKYTGSGPVGDPTQWTVTGPFPGFAANVLSNSGEIDLNVTAVPEPSMATGLGLLGMGILARRRRRRVDVSAE